MRKGVNGDEAIRVTLSHTLEGLKCLSLGGLKSAYGVEVFHGFWCRTLVVFLIQEKIFLVKAIPRNL